MSSWNWASNPLTGGEPPRRSSSHLLVWRALTIQFLLGTVEIAFGLRANTRMPPATEAPQVQEILYAHCATAWGNHVEEVLSEHHHVKINHRRRGSIGHFRSKRTKVAVVVFFFHCMLHIQFYRHLQNQDKSSILYRFYIVHHCSKFHPAQETVSCQPCTSIQHSFIIKHGWNSIHLKVPWFEPSCRYIWFRTFPLKPPCYFEVFWWSSHISKHVFFDGTWWNFCWLPGLVLHRGLLYLHLDLVAVADPSWICIAAQICRNCFLFPRFPLKWWKKTWLPADVRDLLTETSETIAELLMWRLMILLV